MTFAFLAGAATSAHRCARESWPVENYHAYIFHRGELDPADQELVELIASAPAKLGLNLLVSTVDTAEALKPDLAALWEVQTNAELPWLVVQSPHSARSNGVTWATALRTPAVGALLTSPVRQRIAGHLVEGHTAVWLMVECGEPIRDEVAIDTLTATLAQLVNTRVTPQTNGPEIPASTPAPQFSLVRVTREDPGEQFLLRSLGIDAENNPSPILIPIFGRGRTLPPLSGRKLSEHSVVNVCRQLLGECTNSLREDTSGSELLLGADWDKPVPTLLTNSSTPLATELKERGRVASSANGTVDSTSPEASRREQRWIDLEGLGGFAAGLVLAALAGFAIVRVWRSRT